MIYDHIRPDERMIIEAAKKRGIPIALYDADKMFFNITDPERLETEPIMLQRSISYFRGLHITALLESK